MVVSTAGVHATENSLRFCISIFLNSIVKCHHFSGILSRIFNFMSKSMFCLINIKG